MFSHSLLFFVTLAAAVAPGFSQLSTACFPSGTVGDCSQFIPQFCDNVSKDSVNGSNTISQCFNTPGKSFKCDLTAVNTLTTVTDNPANSSCRTALTTISKDCPMGGDGIVTGGIFRFVIDPNNGTCGLPCGD
ncbi:hypothetical protein B0H19DRAFT_1264720 [Mycena capillaripes]|nr:hypothetical protein B0H19DRAFT_1264720 [Mycena capillaripes]